ncbi:MAG TPA: ABC transporter permease subunit [Gemmatimonadaceae bacterium]|jgi:Cu-processing system permease protein|nr:ABC transporter permease subunit [Gemmatimonadaceae bacterium]
MNPLMLVLKAGVRDLARNRWLLAYGIVLAVITEALFFFGGTGHQVVLSLLNATLLLVPLVALVFGAMHVYASREFIELLLAQPLSRAAVFTGLYLGLAIPLAGAFLAGIGLPMLIHGIRGGAPMLALTFLALGGALLTAAFAALAMAIALRTDDRLRGMAMALGAWFLFTIGYDGAVLAVVSAFGDWPLERPLLALMLGNPVDVARVLVLTSLDASALLGYTGALFRRAFGTGIGPAIALVTLTLWAVIPVVFARRRFLRRDF